MKAANSLASNSPIFGEFDLLDGIIDLFEGPGRRASDLAVDFGTKLIERGSDGLKSTTKVLSRTIKYVQLTVIGLKIVKFLFISDGDADPIEVFVALNDVDPKEQSNFRDAFNALVARERATLSGMGLTLMDPVWLADPKV